MRYIWTACWLCGYPIGPQGQGTIYPVTRNGITRRHRVHSDCLARREENLVRERALWKELERKREVGSG
jgi:hypothetical protein